MGPSLLYWWCVCQVCPHHLPNTSLWVISNHGDHLCTDHRLLQHTLHCNHQSCQLCWNERRLNVYYTINRSVLLLISVLVYINFLYSRSVACPSSLSAASGVVDIQIPSVTTVGSTLTFTCSDNQMRDSICGSDGRWSPNPEDFMCSTIGVYNYRCAVRLHANLMVFDCIITKTIII